jgi:hypothetical protein
VALSTRPLQEQLRSLPEIGGEVTLGATGFLGAYLGAHVGAAVGAANGLTKGALLAGICYAGFEYDN